MLPYFCHLKSQWFIPICVFVFTVFQPSLDSKLLNNLSNLRSGFLARAHTHAHTMLAKLNLPFPICYWAKLCKWLYFSRLTKLQDATLFDCTLKYASLKHVQRIVGILFRLLQLKYILWINHFRRRVPRAIVYLLFSLSYIFVWRSSDCPSLKRFTFSSHTSNKEGWLTWTVIPFQYVKIYKRHVYHQSVRLKTYFSNCFKNETVL